MGDGHILEKELQKINTEVQKGEEREEQQRQRQRTQESETGLLRQKRQKLSPAEDSTTHV